MRSSLKTRLLGALRSTQPEMTSVVFIAILSLFIFYILFNAAAANDYFKEIVAALIATLLTAVITSVLLKAQTGGEEQKERNVEIFRQKSNIYNQLISTFIDALGDKKVSDDEAHDIRKLIYKASLISSAETTDKIVSYFRSVTLSDVVAPYELGDIVNAMRSELMLAESDAGVDFEMEAFDSLRSFGEGAIAEFEQVRIMFDTMMSRIFENVHKTLVKRNLADEPIMLSRGAKEGGLLSAIVSRSIQSELSLIDISGVLEVYVFYPEDKHYEHLYVQAYAHPDRAKAAHRPRFCDAALKRGFEWEEEVDQSSPDRLLSQLSKEYHIERPKHSDLYDTRSIVRDISADMSSMLAEA